MADADPVERRAPRWMKIAFAVSLGLNLLVVGAIAGAILSGGPGERIARMSDGFGPYTRALADEERRAVRRDLIRHREVLREDRAALRNSYDEMQTLLRAETFDRSAAEAVMARQRDVLARRSSHGQGVLLDHLSEMPQAARSAYADRLEEALRRRRSPRRDR